jgi:hypothetical protein
MFEELSDATLVSANGDSARAENKACARRLAAIAELYQRRQIPVEDAKGRELWRIDPWEAVAAEVAAAQGITAAAAGAQLHSAICLQHLIKTYWTGVTGWRDKQLPDGTVIWISPSGHTYRTVPGSRLLMPALSQPTGMPPPPPRLDAGCTDRGAMMPQRRQTRSTERLRRIMAERKGNHSGKRRPQTTRPIYGRIS